jgi:hypothetical protein
MSQTIHSFELIFDVDDELTDLVYDQLHDAGCDDAVFVTRSARDGLVDVPWSFPPPRRPSS